MADLRLMPGTFVKRSDFDVSAYGRNSASGLYDGEPVPVRVRFEPRVAAYAARTRLGQTATDEARLRNGDVELTLNVADADELIRWVLSFGRGAELLSPSALREAVANAARAIAVLHECS